MMSSKQDRLDEAKEFYSQAANCFKLAKNWDRAVECYLECVKCTGEEDSSDIAGYYSEAANCLKNSHNTNKYLEYARIAIERFSLAARLSQAASLAKDCAEVLDEMHDYDEALLFYEKAAGLYQADGMPTQGHQLLIKASDLIILTRDYSKLNVAIKVSHFLTNPTRTTKMLPRSTSRLL